MMAALVAGERNPKVLARLARRTLRKKSTLLEEAFVRRFTDHHAFLLGKMLARLDAISEDIAALDARAATGWLSLMDPPGRVLSCGAAGSRPAAQLDGAVNARCRGRGGLACPPAGRPEASSDGVLAASRSSERPGSFPPSGLTGQAGRCPAHRRRAERPDRRGCRRRARRSLCQSCKLCRPARWRTRPGGAGRSTVRRRCVRPGGRRRSPAGPSAGR